MTGHGAPRPELMEPHAPLEDPEAEDNAYLSYMGHETPAYVTVMWAVALPLLAWYAWRWYLPELSLWMGWG